MAGCRRAQRRHNDLTVSVLSVRTRVRAARARRARPQREQPCETVGDGVVRHLLTVILTDPSIITAVSRIGRIRLADRNEHFCVVDAEPDRTGEAYPEADQRASEARRRYVAPKTAVKATSVGSSSSAPRKGLSQLDWRKRDKVVSQIEAHLKELAAKERPIKKLRNRTNRREQDRVHREHRKQEDKKKKYPKRCGPCDKSFNHFNQWKTHVDTKRHQEKAKQALVPLIGCELCGIPLDSYKAKAQHDKGKKHIKNLQQRIKHLRGSSA
eukprot:IDg23491t1